MDIAGIDPAVVADVEAETSELLSRLIRIDTSNPPGDETRLAEFMDRWFRAAGRGHARERHSACRFRRLPSCGTLGDRGAPPGAACGAAGRPSRRSGRVAEGNRLLSG